MIRQLFSIGTVLVAISLSGVGSVVAADNCNNPQTQQLMNTCAQKSYHKADSELNKLYKQIEARFSDDHESLKLLVKTQRAWIGYRDAECTFSASASAEGSIYPLIYNQCLEAQTQSRVESFKTYLNCEEGDMSCPVPAAD